MENCMGISIYELAVLLVLFGFIIGICALVSVLRSEFTGYNKLIWLLVVLLVPVIGSLLYFFMGRKQRIQKG
ncbi:MAG: hypothetical protein FP816_21675 [Desulfobacteraceae bacterium]|nr:hypothetical protein [Desulfobacteraceae bacterium]MBU4053882.1 PLDc N-terminal domain-containing protein [Pseudomonadota bacterium]